MGNEKMISKIYHNLEELTGGVKRFPETSSAFEQFKTYIEKNYLGNEARQWLELENLLLDVTLAYEKQGFILGFQYALNLLAKGNI